MFNKKPASLTVQNGSTIPGSTIRLSAGRTVDATASYLAPDVTIVGNVVSQSQVHIECSIVGDVQAKAVVVGSGARITGNVVGEDVTVHGRINGEIHGLRITLLAGAYVEGEMHHDSLAIEHGAYFDGRSRRPQASDVVKPAQGTTQIQAMPEGVAALAKPGAA